MKTCPKCNAQFFDDIAFCQNCGTPLKSAAESASTAAAARYCTNCGNKCEGDEKFCTKCGSLIRDVGPVSPTPTPTNEITLQQYYDSYADSELKKNVSSMFWVFLVISIINFVIAIAIGSFPWDGLMLLGLAIFWKYSPGYPCAFLAASYTALTICLGLVLYGTFTGWLIPVSTILMFVYANKLNKAYNEFLEKRR